MGNAEEWFCSRHFNDSFLERNIFEKSAKECSFCHKTSNHGISGEVLKPLFNMLLEVYSNQNSAGKKIAEILQNDWRIFDDNSDDLDDMERLLLAITGDKKVGWAVWSRPRRWGADLNAEWEDFKHRIKSENRWFTDGSGAMPLTKTRRSFEEIQNSLRSDIRKLYPEISCENGCGIEDDSSEVWFRARVCPDPDEPGFSEREMGPPPAEASSGGRVNPAGIPYFYVASSRKTAIAEIRPDVGSRVTVAEFGALTGAVCDLRAPKDAISPLLLDDAERIRTLADVIAFLEVFAEEISRPVLPRKAAVDYVPLQYVCEFLKALGFAGIVFNSSVSSGGVNAVLFDVDHAIRADRVMDLKIHKIKFEESEV